MTRTKTDQDLIDNLTKTIRKLREALYFYAQRKNYEAVEVDRHESMGVFESPIEADEGKRAREALGLV